MSKWIRVRLTERQIGQLKSRAAAERRALTDTVELCLIQAGYIDSPDTPASEPVNGHARQRERTGEEIRADNARYQADQEAKRRAKEKAAALKAGWRWDEGGGHAIDQEGKAIELAADGEWQYVSEI